MYPELQFQVQLDSPEWVANVRRLTGLRILTTPVAMLLVRAVSRDLNAEETKVAESYGVLELFHQLRDEIKAI